MIGLIRAGARQRATLLATTLGLSITILDESVVFVALPAIERDPAGPDAAPAPRGDGV